MEKRAEIDRQTRELLRAIKKTLLDHLGEDAVDPGFWTDLYWRLRRSLADLRDRDRRDADSSYDFERLAMDVYLTAVTHLLRREATPALLSHVKQDIADALTPDSRSVGKIDHPSG